MATIAQLPVVSNIDMVQGDDFSFTAQFQSGSPAVVMNLTDYTFDCHIKTAAANIPLLVYVATPSTGLVLITVTKAQSILLRGDYVWELDMIDPSLNRRTILTGTARIQANG